MADLRSGDGLVAILRHGGPRKYSQVFHFGKLGDDVFGHAVAEVFVFLGAAEVFEVEDGDGFFGFGGDAAAFFCRCGCGLCGFVAAGAGGGFEIALEAFEVGAQFGGGLVAHLAIFFEGFGDDALQLVGQFGIDLLDGFRLLVQDGVENQGRGAAVEGHPAGGHFVENDAERK